MPSKDPLTRFEDILTNIIRLEHHTSGLTDSTALQENELVYDGVERCLERISEAASKLGSEAELLCPEIPWNLIRGLGNVLRHEYDIVDPARIWYTVQDNIPVLKLAVQKTINALQTSNPR